MNENNIENVSNRICPNCGHIMNFKEVESNDGAYIDDKYTCPNCKKTEWVDGIDA